MSVIFKYPFDGNSTVGVPWPNGTRVLHVAAQRAADETPTLWVLHPSQPTDVLFRIFALVGTGHAMQLDKYTEHVGSSVCADGALVWHVFEVSA